MRNAGRSRAWAITCLRTWASRTANWSNPTSPGTPRATVTANPAGPGRPSRPKPSGPRHRARFDPPAARACSSVERLVEAGGRRVADVDEPVMDFHHGEAALDGAVGLEAEDAVDAAEPGGIGQRGGAEIRAVVAARQHGGQQRRVIGDGGEARRIAPVGGVEAAAELLPGSRIGRREPAAD